MTQATLHTSEGPVELELYPDEAPKTVENFTKLAADGYYDGLAFHRVIPDFMIQGGCPTGDGTGGPGYTFEDEFNEHKVARGALAMANAGPNTNGSQFFIVTADACPWLDGKHTVFGQVSDGMDVVDAISGVDTDASDRPRDDVKIESVELSYPALAPEPRDEFHEATDVAERRGDTQRDPDRAAALETDRFGEVVGGSAHSLRA